MNLKFCVIFSNFHNRRNNEQCVTSHFWQLPHDIWQSHSMNSCLAKRAPFQSCVSQLDLKSFIMFPFLLCMSSFCSHPFLFFFLAVFCLWCYFGIYSFVESQPVPVKCKHKHMTTYVQNRCGFCKNSNINSVDEKQVRGSPQYYGAGTNWLYRTQIKKKCHEKNDCSTSIHNHISMNPPLSANQTQSLNCCFSLSAFGDQHWEDPSKDFDRMWWIWQMWTLSTCTGRSCSKLTFVSAIPFFCCPVATIQFYAILVQFQHLLLCDNCLACQQPVKTKPVRAIANT